ncbi:MAG TPA: amino acid permease, partial [Candidatus Eisenbacteria bacterium]|nr:amino acid permease [Candidatus Eisenbacteria bacterium]
MTSGSRLERRLGLGGAVAVGVGAMLGTGVFAAWTPALRLAGSALLVSLALAAVVAALNAWSTAALARVHPESG